jgi:DNA-binding CsgD family transcriptional regulator
MAGLADRIDDALPLLTGRDVLAAARHRSLSAVAEWSYRLLSAQEQQVLRRLSVFPGAFTMEGAEALAGPEAASILLRLVDCSLVLPPRPGPDRRPRYAMLRTLRAFAEARLAETGEEDDARAALAAFELAVAERAAEGLDTTDREEDAVRWLDAEDAALSWALPWLLGRDPDSGLRLAASLAPWWWVRGRGVEGFGYLLTAVRRASAAAPARARARAQVWLGHMSASSGDAAGLAAYFDAAGRDGGDKSREYVEALLGKATNHVNRGDVASADRDAQLALAKAREIGYFGGEVKSLANLALSAYYAGNQPGAIDYVRQAREMLLVEVGDSPREAALEPRPADIPGYASRWSYFVLAHLLTETGEFADARRIWAVGLALSRRVADTGSLGGLLYAKVNIELRTGNIADAGARLREFADVAIQTGDRIHLANCVEMGAYLSAETQRWADAVTLWAAEAAELERIHGRPVESPLDGGRKQFAERIEQTLPADEIRRAEARGARMPLATAVELATMVAAAVGESHSPDSLTQMISPRERELIALVAQGRTNAEIAAELFISVRTVASHLDRIRDKTGCRRRADLTRLALSEGLV